MHNFFNHNDNFIREVLPAAKHGIILRYKNGGLNRKKFNFQG